jgi:hypothetical protein
MLHFLPKRRDPLNGAWSSVVLFLIPGGTTETTTSGQIARQALSALPTHTPRRPCRRARPCVPAADARGTDGDRAGFPHATIPSSGQCVPTSPEPPPRVADRRATRAPLQATSPGPSRTAGSHAGRRASSGPRFSGGVRLSGTRAGPRLSFVLCFQWRDL